MCFRSTRRERFLSEAEFNCLAQVLSSSESAGGILVHAIAVIRPLLRHPEPDARGLDLRGALKSIHSGLLGRAGLSVSSRGDQHAGLSGLISTWLEIAPTIVSARSYIPFIVRPFRAGRSVHG